MYPTLRWEKCSERRQHLQQHKHKLRKLYKK